MSRKQECESISPGNMRWNSSFFTCCSMVPISRSTSRTVDSSFSSTASVNSSSASFRPLAMRSSVPTMLSRRARSRPSSCARSGVFQMAGSSSSRLTSARRSLLRSYSKKPPERLAARIEVFERSAELIDFHGTNVEFGAAMLARVTPGTQRRPRTDTRPARRSTDDAQMLDDELHLLRAVELIHVEPIGELDAILRFDERCIGVIEMAECDRLAGAAVLAAHVEPQMPLADHAHAANAKRAVEERLRKCLAPRAGFAQQARDLDRELGSAQLAVRIQHAHRIFGRDPSTDFRVERRAKFFQAIGGQRQTRSHCMPAEFQDQTGMPRRDRIEHIANVHARHGARGAFQRALVAARERDHRPMHAVLDARGDEPDDALVPSLVVQAQTERQPPVLREHRFDRRHRFLLHLQLQLAAILIELRK